MLNETNEFIPVAAAPSRRPLSVGPGVGAERDRQPRPGLRVREPGWHDDEGVEPRSGRALITGKRDSRRPERLQDPDAVGVSRTAPYFHDNSAKTLEDMMVHYKKFFAIVTDPKSTAILRSS